jgi:hypothetical protein
MRHIVLMGVVAKPPMDKRRGTEWYTYGGKCFFVIEVRMLGLVISEPGLHERIVRGRGTFSLVYVKHEDEHDINLNIKNTYQILSPLR